MAWTITETVEIQPVGIKGKEEEITIKLVCESDANGTDYDITESTMRLIRGGYLREMYVVPGSGADEPSAAFNIDLEDENDYHLLDTDSNAADANTAHDGATTMGHYPVIRKRLSFVPATLGDGNTATVYIRIWK